MGKTLTMNIDFGRTSGLLLLVSSEPVTSFSWSFPPVILDTYCVFGGDGDGGGGTMGISSKGTVGVCGGGVGFSNDRDSL